MTSRSSPRTTRTGAAPRYAKWTKGRAAWRRWRIKIVRYLYDEGQDKQTGERSFALVRLFKTHPYDKLDAGLQEFAGWVLGHAPESPTVKCLTLLATVGAKEEWSSRRASNGHKTIPLASEEMVKAFPMISNLVSQCGLQVTDVLNPAPRLACRC